MRRRLLIAGAAGVLAISALALTPEPLVSGSFFKNSGTQGFTWYGQ